MSLLFKIEYQCIYFASLHINHYDVVNLFYKSENAR